MKSPLQARVLAKASAHLTHYTPLLPPTLKLFAAVHTIEVTVPTTGEPEDVTVAEA